MMVNCLFAWMTECRSLQQQLADTTAELSECRSQLSACQSESTDKQKHYDDLITARDETISQLHRDSSLLQQRVTVAFLHHTN